MVMPRSFSMSIEFEHLLLARHFTRVEPAGELDQPVGERGFAVVDVGDDGEIADILNGDGRHGGQIALAPVTFKRTEGAIDARRAGVP